MSEDSPGFPPAFPLSCRSCFFSRQDGGHPELLLLGVLLSSGNDTSGTERETTPETGLPARGHLYPETCLVSTAHCAFPGTPVVRVDPGQAGPSNGQENGR